MAFLITHNCHLPELSTASVTSHFRAAHDQTIQPSRISSILMASKAQKTATQEHCACCTTLAAEGFSDGLEHGERGCSCWNLCTGCAPVLEGSAPTEQTRHQTRQLSCHGPCKWPGHRLCGKNASSSTTRTWLTSRRRSPPSL